MKRFPMASMAFAAAAITVIAAPAFAGPAFEAGVRGTYWFPKLTATVQTFDPVLGGTEFNAKDDLGVGDKNIPSGEVFVRFGRVRILAGYMPVKFDGNSQLSRTIVFAGQTFNVNDNVVTNLDVKMIDGEIQVDLLRPDLVAASFSLGVVAKVRYVDGQVDLRSAAAGQQTRDFKAPIPMLGLAAGAGFLKDMLRADAKVTGMAYAGHHLYEGDASASFVPFPFFRVQGGYRIIDLKIDKTDDIIAKLKLKGPYLGAQLSF